MRASASMTRQHDSLAFHEGRSLSMQSAMASEINLNGDPVQAAEQRLPGVTVVLPVKGRRCRAREVWAAQLSMQYGAMYF